jgi:hypothetical protein
MVIDVCVEGGTGLALFSSYLCGTNEQEACQHH